MSTDVTHETGTRTLLPQPGDDAAIWWAVIRSLESLARTFPARRLSFYARCDAIETQLRRLAQ